MILFNRLVIWYDIEYLKFHKNEFIRSMKGVKNRKITDKLKVKTKMTIFLLLPSTKADNISNSTLLQEIMNGREKILILYCRQVNEMNKIQKVEK